MTTPLSRWRHRKNTTLPPLRHNVSICKYIFHKTGYCLEIPIIQPKATILLWQAPPITYCALRKLPSLHDRKSTPKLCQKLLFFQNMGRTCCVHQLFWMSKTISVHSMLSPCSELGIFMYWTCNSMNNMSSYCGCKNKSFWQRFTCTVTMRLRVLRRRF